MTATIVRLSERGRPYRLRIVPAPDPDSWFERELRDSWQRIFGAQRPEPDRPCDSEGDGAA